MGFQGVPGPKKCTAGMHGILHMATVSAQGVGTRDPGPLSGGSESPSTTLSKSETGSRVDHSTVFGASHTTFRRQRFLGVGGSGRSPLECASPQMCIFGFPLVSSPPGYYFPAQMRAVACTAYGGRAGGNLAECFSPKAVPNRLPVKSDPAKSLFPS